MSKLEKIISWIEVETNLKYGNDWGKSENLLEAGLLDSTKLMRLLVYIEELLDEELDDEKISYEHLVSLEKIDSWYLLNNQ